MKGETGNGRGKVRGGRGGVCADGPAGLPRARRTRLRLRLQGRAHERVRPEAQHRRHYRHRPGRGAHEVGFLLSHPARVFQLFCYHF